MARLLFIALFFLIPMMASAGDKGGNGIYVLGVAQDGGYPHAGCVKKCCTMAWEQKSMQRNVVSLAVAGDGHWWLFEATPDIKAQLQYFRELTGGKYNYLPDGIFITHAHIGHYTGLVQLGREVMNTKEVPVYVLPKMKAYLETNGPWSQLVKLNNIRLEEITPAVFGKEGAAKLPAGRKYNDGFEVAAFTVPHRDEFSETAGFSISVNGRRYIFIPDIDKWGKWNVDIRDIVQECDVALLDGTFYEDGELPGRSMAEVPHPFVSETMKLFSSNKDGTPVFDSLKSKIHFIHFNHTNPLLWDKAKQNEVKKEGFSIAEQGEKL